jgi:tetratricopeptide (TPR) repeat protein
LSWNRLAFRAALALFGAAVLAGLAQSYRFEGTLPRVTLQYQWYLDELARRGREDDVAREWSMVSEIDAVNRSTALTNLGASYVRRGDLAKAGEILREALALDPGSADARVNLGSALAGEGRYDEAIEQLEQVLRERPNHRAARSNLAVIREFQGGSGAGRQGPSPRRRARQTPRRRPRTRPA